MLEGQTVARFIYDLLTADAGVGGVNTLVSGQVHRGRVPEGIPLPAVTVAVVDGTDFNAHDGEHIAQDVQIDVTVRGDGETFDEIEPIASRIFVVLQLAEGVKDGVYVVRLRRTDTTEFQTGTRGKPYSHIVQTFFTEAEPA